MAMPHVPEIAHPICECRILRALREAGFVHVGRRRLQAWPGCLGLSASWIGTEHGRNAQT